HHGVCKKCYGRNLATAKPVTTGEAVGIVAAQSIGEPGTQLTMRTFHTGGVASAADITQGLPRVEELFEGRKPKSLAIISEISGTCSIQEIKSNKHAVITNTESGEERSYLIPFGSRLRVQDGDFIAAGDVLTEGSVNPHDVLAIKGTDALHNYLIQEVQRTYRMQGVDINDKHIEVIVRQMMKKVKIDEQGSTDFLPGSVVEKSDFEAQNAAIQRRIDDGEAGLVLATATPMLLGITKASLATDSFLSAASFQETTRVLTDAAIKGKKDPLIGLKENVIIGKLVPAGTGMKCYNQVTAVPVEEPAAEAPVFSSDEAADADTDTTTADFFE
ncbi:MAG: DNA-directed RNA polymerase subunit beta', partial [Clostridia bacterium]|nr:DNA-directed RNA polymerase subunit beta' [Clostridia bacterium]